DTKDTVDSTTGGTIDDTKDTVDKTTGTTTETVDTTTGGTSGGSSGGSTLDELLGGGGSGTPTLDDFTPGLIDELLDEAAVHGLSPAAAEGWINGKKMLSASQMGRAAAALVSLSALIEDLASQIAQAGIGSNYEMELAAASGNSFFADAGRVAAAAAKALAFPLALALLVVGFLVVQGRIGRSDPKLALAPVNAREETLTFE
ncbi:MAG: hypothetical protein KY391_03415, partial [Actinobacteria bacterium]|nr:hypothetical protein [Actinomycetota bacterium]